jgi:hypothetical protein
MTTSPELSGADPAPSSPPPESDTLEAALLADDFICPAPERLECLRDYFLELADPEAPLSLTTREYLSRGGSLRIILSQLAELTPDRATEQACETARDTYLDTLLGQNIAPWKHDEHLESETAAREAYVSSVLARIEEVLDADTDEQAFEIQQMPSLVQETSFGDSANTPTDFAGNHLYLLLDTCAREHLARRAYIDQHKQGSLVARFMASRRLRTVAGAGVFALALSPHLGLLVGDHEEFREKAEFFLRSVSGTVFSTEALALARYTLADRKHKKEFTKLREEISEEPDLTDLSFRAIYSSTRHGDEADGGPILHRSGSDDPETNLAHLKKLDQQFPHLNNDPGGKPYSGDQALGYAGRFFIERREQIDAILSADLSGPERRASYMQLCREVLEEDLRRMRYGLVENRFRRLLFNVVALPPAIAVSKAAAFVSEAKTFTHEFSKATVDRERS